MSPTLPFNDVFGVGQARINQNPPRIDEETAWAIAPRYPGVVPISAFAIVRTVFITRPAPAS